MTKEYKYNWDEIQKYYNLGGSWKSISETFGCASETINNAVKRGDLITRTRHQTRLKRLELGKTTPFKHSEETKKLISEKRKKFLKENPDKHPWRKENTFKSEPCERLKSWLVSKSVKFIPEYTNHGVTDRHFSIDIAMPDKRVALEVNGNQHYNRDGSLKPYYEERKSLLESVGWKVYDIHYSMCYRLDKHEELFLKISNSDTKVDFVYKL